MATAQKRRGKKSSRLFIERRKKIISGVMSKKKNKRKQKARKKERKRVDGEKELFERAIFGKFNVRLYKKLNKNCRLDPGFLRPLS